MSLPSRTKRSSGRTRTSDVEVAGAAAERARVALAREADPLAVVDAGRDLDVERPLSSVRPAPAHVSHGCSTLRPRAAALGQADVRTNSPKTLRETCCSRPVPPQRWQTRDDRARLDAVAAAGRARDRDLERDRRRFAPRAASTRSISTSRRDVGAARRPPAPPPPKRSSPKNAEKRSPRLPKSKCVGREAARAQAGVAVAVVELRASRDSRAPRRPRTTSRKRASASGSLGDVRVELARERAERLLDLALVGVARDAEQLVVVAFGGRHAARIVPAAVACAPARGSYSAS